MEQHLPSRIHTGVNNHLRVRRLLPEGVSIPDDIIQAAIREVMEDFPGIPASSPADCDANGHMGSTTGGLPLPETTMNIGGPSNFLANPHTTHTPPVLAPAHLPTSWTDEPPSFILPSDPSPLLNTHSIPSLPWNFGPVYGSPTSSALDLALHNSQSLLHQQPTTDSAPPAEALGSPATALPGSWSNPTHNDWGSFEPLLSSTDIEALLCFDDNSART